MSNTISKKDNQHNKKLKNNSDELTKAKYETLGFVKSMLLGIIVGLFVTQFLAVISRVPSCSMEPTIETGANFLTNKIIYKISEPKRGDIIVFSPPKGVKDSRGNKEYFVKRLIGLGGETIEGKEGKVYINNKPLDEPYIDDAITYDFGPFEIPEDAYFMMGDNRENSFDARYWKNKYVYDKDILGKAWIKIRPTIRYFKSVVYNID